MCKLTYPLGTLGQDKECIGYPEKIDYIQNAKKMGRGDAKTLDGKNLYDSKIKKKLRI